MATASSSTPSVSASAASRRFRAAVGERRRRHLVERFRLLDGERLEVTSTWDDRAMFSRPHTYAFLYYRARNAAEPRVFNCLPNDPVRSKFLLESPVPAR